MDYFEVRKVGNGFELFKKPYNGQGSTCLMSEIFVFNTLDQMFVWIREQYKECGIHVTDKEIARLKCGVFNRDQGCFCEAPLDHSGDHYNSLIGSWKT